jgi:hypothetical protein
MGFVLEEAPLDQQQFLETSLNSAVTKTANVIASLSNATLEEFEERVGPLKPRVLKAVTSFATTMVEFAAETTITDEDTKLHLTSERLKTLSDRLREMYVQEDEQVRVGTLTGVLPDQLTFEFRPDDQSSDLYGNVTEEVAAHYSASPSKIVRHGTAEFLILKTIRSGHEVGRQMILKSFTPDSDSTT